MVSANLDAETRPLPGEVVIGSDEARIRFADRRQMIHPYDGRVFFAVELTAPSLTARLDRVTNFADGHGLVDFLAEPGQAREWVSADRDLAVVAADGRLTWRISGSTWSAEVTTPFDPGAVAGLREFLVVPEPVDTAVIQEAGRWGRKAAERAALGAGMSLPAWQLAVELTGIGAGTRVLDLGCGSGEFCGLATEAGAQATGIDASAAMVEVARKRAPGAEFHVWPLGKLPWGDDAFDVVTAFNALFFAAEPEIAFAEAMRTSRNYVVVCNWHPERLSDLLAVGRAVRGPARRRLPELPQARDELTIHIPLVHADEDTMLRGFLSVGAYQRVIESEGEEKVAERIKQAAEPFRMPDGGYRFENYYRMQIFQKHAESTNTSE